MSALSLSSDSKASEKRLSEASLSQSHLPLECGLRYDVCVMFSPVDALLAGHIVHTLQKRGVSVATLTNDRSSPNSDEQLSESAVFAVCLSQSCERDVLLKDDVLYAISGKKESVAILFIPGDIENKDKCLGFGWVGLASSSVSLGAVILDPASATFPPPSRASSVAFNRAIESICQKVLTAAREIPGSPAYRIAKQEAAEYGNEDISYVRPGSSLSQHRKPRLSILRPRSSLWNIAAGNKLVPNAPVIPEKKKLS
ncbi:hypothetical protein HDU99_002026, partial [Rhizoclosmatium hyalinum]